MDGFRIDAGMFGCRKIRRLPGTYGGEMLTFEKILPADSRTYTRAREITQPDSG
ncbi:MAG: hypothetical protein LBF62_03935 [Tannerellaceae bacterium]|nr:hypothetical protein [Tannerellaceae bacterium]